MTSTLFQRTTRAQKMMCIALALAVLAPACGGQEDDAWIEETAAAITQGQPDSGHESVGLLLNQLTSGQSQTCTATLIGARTVLTAAHCALGVAQARFVLGGAIVAGQLSGGQPYDVETMTPHPAYQGTNGDHSADIAVIRLRTAPNVTPTPISRTAPWSGLALTLVGFGLTSATDDGSNRQKRMTQNMVSSLGSSTIALESGGGGVIGTACFGDSGGPAFAYIYGGQAQVAVHSRGLSAENPCMDVAEVRVDPYVTWIEQIAEGDVSTIGDATNTAIPSSGTSETFTSQGPQQINAVACTSLPAAAGPPPGWLPIALLMLGAPIAQRERRRLRASRSKRKTSR